MKCNFNILIHDLKVSWILRSKTDNSTLNLTQSSIICDNKSLRWVLMLTVLIYASISPSNNSNFSHFAFNAKNLENQTASYAC